MSAHGIRGDLIQLSDDEEPSPSASRYGSRRHFSPYVAPRPSRPELKRKRRPATTPSPPRKLNGMRQSMSGATALRGNHGSSQREDGNSPDVAIKDEPDEDYLENAPAPSARRHLLGMEKIREHGSPLMQAHRRRESEDRARRAASSVSRGHSRDSRLRHPARSQGAQPPLGNTSVASGGLVTPAASWEPAPRRTRGSQTSHTSHDEDDKEEPRSSRASLHRTAGSTPSRVSQRSGNAASTIKREDSSPGPGNMAQSVIEELNTVLNISPPRLSDQDDGLAIPDINNQNPSSPDEDDDTDDIATEVTTQTDIAKFLYNDLAKDAEFGGCSEEDHQESQDNHDIAARGDCQPLSATYNAMAADNKMGLSAHLANRFPRKATARMKPRDAKDLERWFCGQMESDDDADNATEGIPDDRLPRNLHHICLHTEAEAADTKPSVAYDVDSYMFMPKSLAALRTLSLAGTDNKFARVRTDLHFTVKCKFRDDSKQRGFSHQQRSLHRIPHIYLGSSHIPAYAEVFVFFPAMVEAGETRKAAYLSDRIQQIFRDYVVDPSLGLRPDERQHFPTGYESAAALAKARSRESGGGGRQQLLQYVVQRPALIGLEDRMNKIIADTVQLKDFEDFFFFITAKNSKLSHKTDAGLAQCMTNWYDDFQSQVDIQHIDKSRMWVDVAKEVVPQGPDQGGNNDDGVEHEPHVYLYRTCDLERVADRYHRNIFRSAKGRVKIFNIGTLRDAADMTILPPRKSPAHKHGLYYSQWYSSAKEAFDAAGTYPFHTKRMHELSIDSNVWTGLAKAKGSRRTLSQLQGAYCWAKSRVGDACHATCHKSYGVRKEHRINGHLFDKLLALAMRRETTATGEASDRPSSLARAPTYVWSVKSIQWTNFVYGNYHKITSAFEMGIRSSQRATIALEQTRVLFMLLKLLRNFFNADWARYPMLSETIKEGPGVVRRGMGMEATMKEYGFGWWLPRVDWHTFMIRKDYQKTLPTVGAALMHRMEPSAVIQKLGVQAKLDMYLEMYQDLAKPENEAYGDRGRVILHHLICHLCMSEMRKYVKGQLISYNELEHNGPLEADNLSFYADVFEAGNPGGVTWSDPWKRKDRLGLLLDIWWGFDTKESRKKIDTLDWRQLWTSAFREIHGRHGVYESSSLVKVMRDVFWLYHYAMPSPESGEMFCTDKARRRRFWAVDPPCKGSAGGPPPGNGRSLPKVRLTNKPRAGISPPLPPAETQFTAEQLWLHITMRTSMYSLLTPGFLDLGEVEELDENVWPASQESSSEEEYD